MMREIYIGLISVPVFWWAGYAAVRAALPDASVELVATLSGAAGVVLFMLVLGCLRGAIWATENVLPAGRAKKRAELQIRQQWSAHESDLKGHLQTAVRTGCDQRFAEGDVRRVQATFFQRPDGTFTCWPLAYEARLGGGRVHLGDEDHAYLRQATSDALSKMSVEALRFLQEYRRGDDLNLTIWKRS